MNQESSQTSSRPYLLRAMHEWMSDGGNTPLVVVDASFPGVQVPEDFIEDGRIVLNISWSATENLVMDNEAVSFNARFGGVGQSVYLPVDSIIAVYARESGQGMVFQAEPEAASADMPLANQDNKPEDEPPSRPSPDRPKGPPGLRIVK
ncbi:MAG: ClpXP protease specificity-enhancing factor [Gammaproteobacteria bacterium]